VTIKVMIVDEYQITREGIRSMLERESGMELLGEAEDGRSAVKLAKELNPDVVIMEVCMPEMNGIVATSHSGLNPGWRSQKHFFDRCGQDFRIISV